MPNLRLEASQAEFEVPLVVLGVKDHPVFVHDQPIVVRFVISPFIFAAFSFRPPRRAAISEGRKAQEAARNAD